MTPGSLAWDATARLTAPFWRLHLRPQSGQVTGEVEEVAQALRNEVMAGISAADLATTLSVLDRVRERLTQLDREDRGEPAPRS